MKRLVSFLFVAFLCCSILPESIYAQTDGVTVRDQGNKPKKAKAKKAKAMKAKQKMNERKDYSTKKASLIAEHQPKAKFMNQYENMMSNLVVRNKEEQKEYWLGIFDRLEEKGHISPNSPLRAVADWNLGENTGYTKKKKDKLIRVLSGDQFTELEVAIANALVEIEDIPQEEYEGDVQASTGEDVGGAVGTIIGGIAGFISGGPAGALAGAAIGAELGKIFGKAIATISSFFGGGEGKGKGGDDKDEDDKGGDDAGDVEEEPTGVETIDNGGKE